MKKIYSVNLNLVKIGILFALLALVIYISSTSIIKENNRLQLAVTLDLLITIPLVYFFLIRTTKIPKTTVVPVMIIGLLIGLNFLPKESQAYLNLFKIWVLPLIELFILTYVIVKVRKAVKMHRRTQIKSLDFYDSLKETCSEILPKKLVLPFATEVAVFYYGFFDWKKVKLDENEFSYHLNSGTPALMGAFILIIGIETIAIHFLLAQWSSILAWILSILSIYTALQVFGFAKSLTKRPISINLNDVSLRYGILNEVRILITDIVSVEKSNRTFEEVDHGKTLSPLGGIESHNIVIKLKYDHELIGWYGFKKEFQTLAFFVDKPDEFILKLEEARKQTL